MVKNRRIEISGVFSEKIYKNYALAVKKGKYGYFGFTHGHRELAQYGYPTAQTDRSPSPPAVLSRPLTAPPRRFRPSLPIPIHLSFNSSLRSTLTTSALGVLMPHHMGMALPG